MLAHDITGQIACYAPMVEPFFQHPTATLQLVADEKTRLMKSYPVVKTYSVSNVEFAEVEPSYVKLSLDKTWALHGTREFSGSEREILTLRQFDGQWKIVAESEATIYWVRTK
jgi:hypothetical protein